MSLKNEVASLHTEKLVGVEEYWGSVSSRRKDENAKLRLDTFFLI